MATIALDIDAVPPEKLDAVIAQLEAEKQRRVVTNKLAHYQPYARQGAFHAAGAKHRERLLMAGNQLGKTLAGAMEAAIHATGRYPDWWQGKRFDKPTVSWVAGTTGETVRDTVQRMLIGRPGEEGTAAIPKDAIVELVPARGIADLLDGIKVRHVSGGISTIGIKSYLRGRESFGRNPRFHLVRRRTAAGRVPRRLDANERIAWAGMADVHTTDRRFDSR